MGNLKKQALQASTEDVTTHQLTDAEINYLKLLNLTLQYHTHGQKIMSGFLYYVAVNRLGYPDGVNLLFQLDLEKEDKLLTVKLMPEEPEKPPALDNKA